MNKRNQFLPVWTWILNWIYNSLLTDYFVHPYVNSLIEVLREEFYNYVCLFQQNKVHLIKIDEKVGASEATLLNMLKISPFSYGLKILQGKFDVISIMS